MTISTTSSATTLGGNGVTTTFNFGFIAGVASNVLVIYTTSAGITSTLSPSQYILALNAPAAGAIWGVGGTVTYPTSGSPIPSGSTITIQRIVPLTQSTTISNQGDFYAQSVEKALDTLCLEIQQVSARTGQLRGVWATGQSYNYGDVVQDGINGAGTNNLYMCAIANTSGVWATDLAAGDWSLALNIKTLQTLGSYLPLAGGTLVGNLIIQAALSVTGATTLAGLAASGNATVGGTLGVTGNTTVGGTLGVTGVATFTAAPIMPTQAANTNNTTGASTAFVKTAIAAIPIIQNVITGFLPSSIAGTNTTATLTASAGQATDSTNASYLTLGSQAWAVSNGNAANGYQGGTTLPNSSTIHFFVINGASGTATFASTSLTPTLPSGYTLYRRIFSLNTTAGGALIPGAAIETEGGSILFYLTTQVLDINTAAQGTSRIQYALTVPTGIKVQPFFRANTQTVNAVLVTSGDETDVAPTSTGAISFSTAPGFDMQYQSNANVVASIPMLGNAGFTTNTSGQIGIRAASTSTSVLWDTRGFKDFRRA